MVRRTSLKEIIGTEDEVDFLNAIKKFYCQDKDVEKFLKEQSFEFDKRRKSRTYLFFDENYLGEIIILGYFTLTMKNLPFKEGVSKTTIKRIDGFSKDVSSTQAVLIGQIGKDFNYKNYIRGKTILDMAIEVVYASSDLIGGRIVFLECSDNEKIVSFYKNNGFIFLQNSESGEYLQMIRYL